MKAKFFLLGASIGAVLASFVTLAVLDHRAKSSSDVGEQLHEFANLDFVPDDDKGSNALLKLFLGTWRSPKDTNNSIRFLPFGKVAFQNDEGTVDLLTYEPEWSSNTLLFSASNAVPFYFLSQNEVLFKFDGKSTLFRRDTTN